jgi:hypothetical protein
MHDPLKDLYYKAFETFLVEERSNILNGTAERNLAARLGYIMERFKEHFGFAGYYADPEYNRMQDGRIKVMLDENLVEIRIQCDLLLHGRGERGPRENLIAIEMKKSGRPPEETLDDQRRLRALTTPPGPNTWSGDGETFPEYVCGYQLGILVELDISRTRYRVEEYRSGRMEIVRTGPF